MDDVDALVVARQVISEQVGAVRWAVLAGSVLTSARTTGSDLDIVVVVDPRPGVPFRQSLTVAGWPVELFVNDPAGLDHYLAKDLARRQPSLQRMCATGMLLTGPDRHHQQVRAACAAVIAAGPPPLPEPELAELRYGLSDLRDDLVHSTDPGETVVIAAVCWLRIAELALHAGGHWLGSGKWLLRELRDYDPPLAGRWLAAGGDPQAVAVLAGQVRDRVVGRCSTATRLPANNHRRLRSRPRRNPRAPTARAQLARWVGHRRRPCRPGQAAAPGSVCGCGWPVRSPAALHINRSERVRLDRRIGHRAVAGGLLLPAVIPTGSRLVLRQRRPEPPNRRSWTI